MVIAVLGALAGMAKVRDSHTAVDSHVFRLHYRWTTTFCFACCALVTAKEYVGDAIECIADSVNNLKPITTYCWINSVYTINSSDSFMKGVGAYDAKIHEKTFHSYYQWVSVVLFFQGCLFYFPHLLWKWYESKRVDALLQDLNKGLFHEDTEEKKKNILDYLKESWGLNGQYVSLYHMCETMNFWNVVVQMYALDKFFGGLFMNYGLEVLDVVGRTDAQRYDTLITTFPRLTKCDFMRYGPSGTIQNLNALCILPQNIINEKIFLVMWLWFVILAFVTTVWLVWRMALMSSWSLRRRLLEYLASTRFSEKTERALRDLHLGDFCLLENIGYNLDILLFKDIIDGITDINEMRVPSAPLNTGTYKKPPGLSGSDTIPRLRNAAFIDDSL